MTDKKKKHKKIEGEYRVLKLKIKKDNLHYSAIEEMSYKSNNLYNRGLFASNNGIYINSDINSAGQIAKKAKCFNENKIKQVTEYTKHILNPIKIIV